MRSVPWLFLLVAVTCSACASEHRSEDAWGWFASPASFSMASDDADWSFTVDGSDLRLRNHSRQVVLTGFVPADGVRYRILDAEDPHVEFISTDGEHAAWEDDEVEFRGETLMLVE